MKALIVKKAYDGKEIGTIESIVEDNSPILKKENQHRFFNNLQIINIPDDLVGKPIKSVSLPHSDYFWSKEGEADVTTEPVIAEHWIKDGVTVFTEPMIDEYWSKAGETDSISQPLIDRWTKDGEADLFVDPLDDTWTFEANTNDESWDYNPSIVDPTYSHVSEQVDSSWAFHPEVFEGDLAIELDTEKYKIERINKLKSDLDTDLYVKMYEAYGTKDPISATSNYLTWLSMKSSPEMFSSSGIKARFSIASVVAGDSLNTDAEILEYANGLLNASDAYAVYREKAIQDFIVNKLAIEAE